MVASARPSDGESGADRRETGRQRGRAGSGAPAAAGRREHGDRQGRRRRDGGEPVARKRPAPGQARRQQFRRGSRRPSSPRAAPRHTRMSRPSNPRGTASARGGTRRPRASRIAAGRSRASAVGRIGKTIMRATVPSLPERLLERIAREGPISFYDFMRAALYDPADGYYARGAAIGEGGDFLTSPHASPAFAAALARLFAIEAEATAARVDLVEVGAGDGRFLEDFAFALSRIDPQLHECLHLTAVEGVCRGPSRDRGAGHRARAPHSRERGRARGGVGRGMDLLERALRRPARRARPGNGRGARGAARGRRGRPLRLDRRAGAPAIAGAPRAVRRRRSSRGRRPRSRRTPRRSIGRSPGRSPGDRSSRSTTVTRRASCITRSRVPRERSRCTRAAAAAATRWRARASGT